MSTPPTGLVRGVSGFELIGGVDGRIRLLWPAAVPRAASALLDPMSKAATTRTENAGFIGTSIILMAQQRRRGRVPCLRQEVHLQRWRGFSWERLSGSVRESCLQQAHRQLSSPLRQRIDLAHLRLSAMNAA